jgi:hypothetical protein
VPNWCSNKLKITHNNPEMLEKLKGAFLVGRVGETFYPEPNWKEIIAEEKTRKLKEKLCSNGNVARSQLMEELDISAKVTEQDLQKDSRWHDWRINHWSTKWDFGADPDQITTEGKWLCFDFDTAWAPPSGIYGALKSQGFIIRALYSEPGMGFAGIWDDGEDHFYQGNFKNFPKEVIDIFNLESMYEDLT